MESRTGFLISQIKQVQARIFQRLLQESGVESPELLSGLQNLIDTMKELGGATVCELCEACGEDIGAVLGVLYPWTVKNNK